MSLSKTILVVDDDAEDLSLVRQALEDEGYRVVTLADPERAVEEVKSLKPDLVILDEVMPKMMGSEIGMRLLEDPRTRHVPFLFLTSLKTPEDPAPTGHPINRIIAKSSNNTELLHAVSSYL